jgi:hypothetical protein
VVQDMVELAAQGNWSTAEGGVVFGEPGEGAQAQARARERLEDGQEYAPVLYLRPPAPAARALRGELPPVEVPTLGALELRLSFGMTWAAAPRPEEGSEVDGVRVEVAFREAGSGVEWPVLPRTGCVFDGSLEHYVVDVGSLAGRRGQFILSLFPGRDSARDEVAVVSARLVQMT